MSKALSIGTLFIGLVLLGVGYVAGFVFGAPILENAKASEQWPHVTGTITESRIETSRQDGDTMYAALVLYEYAVEDQPLTNDNVWFGGGYSSSDRSDAQDTVNRYPVNKQVEVYYQPDDPANAVLEPGAVFSSYAIYGIGWIFLVIGGLIVVGFLLKLILALAIIGYASQKTGSQFAVSENGTGYSADETEDDFVENL